MLSVLPYGSDCVDDVAGKKKPAGGDHSLPGPAQPDFFDDAAAFLQDFRTSRPVYGSVHASSLRQGAAPGTADDGDGETEFREPALFTGTRGVVLETASVRVLDDVTITGETYVPGESKRIDGRELAQPTVTMETKPGSVLLRYRRLDQ